jgi:hypothetical protein
LTSLAFDAFDPFRLARFWALAIGWTSATGDGDAVALEPTDATSFGIVFVRSIVEKVGQNRIHFDLTTSSDADQDATVASLLDAGASHVDIGQRPDETHVVLADPEGNELCVLESQNRFLAGCPRLGAVNCDGTYELGNFWSAALGWPLVWDHEEETAIQAPDGTGPKITWSGTPLMPRPPRERLHFHIAPSVGTPITDATEALLALGAQRNDRGQPCHGAAASLLDVDGNAFCLEPADPSDDS